VLLVGLWAILNVQNLQGAEGALVKALGLTNIDPSMIRFEYVLIAIVVYLIALYFLYGLVFKSANVRVEKISNGKVQK